jgi:hypothetical protein
MGSGPRQELRNEEPGTVPAASSSNLALQGSNRGHHRGFSKPRPDVSETLRGFGHGPSRPEMGRDRGANDDAASVTPWGFMISSWETMAWRMGHDQRDDPVDLLGALVLGGLELAGGIKIRSTSSMARRSSSWGGFGRRLRGHARTVGRSAAIVRY